MKIQARIIFAVVAIIMLAGCETVYISKPSTLPPPVYVNPPVVGYPSQSIPSSQVPAPIQTPPLPPSVPAKPVAPTVIPANQPITNGDMPVMHTAPEKPSGSMSELPDPS